MSKHSLPSIEKFAAYLDGNLSQDEMKLCEGLAENNETFRQLLGANSLVEETIASYNDVDFEVPEDILNQEFEIPSLDNESDVDDSVLDIKGCSFKTSFLFSTNHFPKSPLKNSSRVSS